MKKIFLCILLSLIWCNAGFTEIDELGAKCEFPKCGHEDDEGCAVILALNNGDIQQSRYNNFMILNGAANL